MDYPINIIMLCYENASRQESRCVFIESRDLNSEKIQIEAKDPYIFFMAVIQKLEKMKLKLILCKGNT
jgi:hypothetical protein